MADAADAWREYARASEADLVRAHLPAARRLVRRLAPAAARGGGYDDLDQEAAVALLEAVRRYDPACGVPFASYALRRVRWRVLDHLRSQASAAGRRAPLGTVDMDGEGGAGGELGPALRAAVERALCAEPAEDAAVRSVLGEQLAEAVAELPYDDRVVLALYWQEELTYEEIARVLGVSVATAWNRHRRALDRLAQKLGAKEEEVVRDR
jgi:RNA polymerase sigma factor for flagellar operon FliA